MQGYVINDVVEMIYNNSELLSCGKDIICILPCMLLDFHKILIITNLHQNDAPHIDTVIT